MRKMAFSIFSGSNYLINEKLFSFTFEALFMNSHIDSRFKFGPANTRIYKLGQNKGKN